MECNGTVAGIKLALIQMIVGEEKKANLLRAKRLIQEAAQNGAKVVILPESFNCPYHEKFLTDFAEDIPDGETCLMLKKVASENHVYTIGSIPESDPSGRRFNTCTVFGPNGDLITTHRKIFMAITDAAAKMVFDESKFFSRGDKLTTFDIPIKHGEPIGEPIGEETVCRVGLGVCRDVRYPELAIAYRAMGCHLVVYPGAFTPKIGEDHHELLHRSRALDSQVYVAAVCPANDESKAFVAYGNSLLVDPWGLVVERAGETETIIYGEVDIPYLNHIRRILPVTRDGINSFFNPISWPNKPDSNS